MRIVNRLRALSILTLSFAGQLFAAEIDFVELNDVVYTFSDSRATVERYNLLNEEFITSLPVPDKGEPLTAGHVDEDGIYLAFGTRLFRYDLNLSNEVFVGLHPNEEVSQIASNNGFILAIDEDAGVGNAGVISISKAMNFTIDSEQSSFEDFLFVPRAGAERGFFTLDNRGEIDSFTIDATGELTRSLSVRLSNSFSSDFMSTGFVGDRIFFTDNQLHFASSGNTARVFPSDIKDGLERNGVPVLLFEESVITLNSNYTTAGTFNIANPGLAIFERSENFYVFQEQDDALLVEIVSISDVNTPLSRGPVSPEGIDFVADQDSVFLANDIVHFLSEDFQTLFRWSIVEQEFLESRNVSGVVFDGVRAFDPSSNFLYIGVNNTLGGNAEILRAPLNGEGSLVFSSFAEFETDRFSASLSRVVIADSLIVALFDNDWFSFNASGVELDRFNGPSLGFNDNVLWDPRNEVLLYSDPWPENDRLRTGNLAHRDLGFGEFGSGARNTDTLTNTNPVALLPSLNGVVYSDGEIFQTDDLSILIPRESVPDANLYRALGDDLVSISESNGNLLFERHELTQLNRESVRVFFESELPEAVLANGSNELVLVFNDAVQGLSFLVLDSEFNVVAPPALSPPALLSVSVGSATSLTLEWTDVSGQETYLLERREEGTVPWLEVGTAGLDETSFIDSSVVAETVYEYRVIAVNGELSSEPSNVLSAVLDVPGIVENFILDSVDATEANLSWGRTPLVLSYDLEFRRRGDSSYSTRTVADTAEFLTNLQVRTEYEARIRGRNAVGVGPWSFLSFETLERLPVAPTNLRTFQNPLSFSISLFWNNPFGGSFPGDNFRLERRELEGVFEVVAEGPITSFLDINVSPDTSYEYRVRLENSRGVSDYSAVFEISTPSLGSPLVPNVNNVIINESGLELLYRLNDPVATAVTIERRIDGVDDYVPIATVPFSAPEILTTTQFSGTYLDTSVVPGFRYTYRVIASNVSGSSAPSSSGTELAVDAVCILREDFEGETISPFVELQGGEVIRDGGQGFPANESVAWFGGAFRRSLTIENLTLPLGGVLQADLRFGNSEVDGVEFWESAEASESLLLELRVGDGEWSPAGIFSDVTNLNFSTVSVELDANERVSMRLIQQSQDGPGLDVFAINSFCVLAHRPMNNPPVVSNQFEESYTSPLGSPLSIDLTEFVSENDPLDSLFFSIAGVSNASLFERFEVGLQSGLLELEFSPYVTGSSIITLSFTDSSGEAVTQELTVSVPPFEVPAIIREGLIEFNPVTGLFEQTITVSNSGDRDIAGFDLIVTGLNADFTLFGLSSNRISSNEVLAQGESRSLTLEYHSPTAGINPRADFEIQVQETPVVVDRDGAAPGDTSLETLNDSSVVFGFSAVVGARYAIEYSSDMVVWNRSPQEVTAGSNFVNWLDQGLPKTDCHPSNCESRYYRAVLLED